MNSASSLAVIRRTWPSSHHSFANAPRSSRFWKMHSPVPSHRSTLHSLRDWLTNRNSSRRVGRGRARSARGHRGRCSRCADPPPPGTRTPPRRGWSRGSRQPSQDRDRVGDRDALDPDSRRRHERDRARRLGDLGHLYTAQRDRLVARRRDQRFSVLAGTPIWEASSLHQAPRSRCSATHAVMRSRSRRGIRWPRPRGMVSSQRRRSRSSRFFMVTGQLTTRSRPGQDGAPRGLTQEASGRCRPVPGLDGGGTHGTRSSETRGPIATLRDRSESVASVALILTLAAKDPRRVRGAHGLPPQACDPRPGLG
jgi:hypothetical protein